MSPFDIPFYIRMKIVKLCILLNEYAQKQILHQCNISAKIMTKNLFSVLKQSPPLKFEVHDCPFKVTNLG